MYRISASDILWKVKGTREIFKFVRRFLESGGSVRYVDCLPQKYNGDTIFELPLVSSLPKRGAGLKYMDRDNDSDRWTCLMSTSANICLKELYQFGKVRCSGSITCLNDSCGAYITGHKRNETSWMGKWRGDHVLKIGETLPPTGLACFHCNQAPACVRSCEAILFYMYPLLGVESEKLRCMSRLALHLGEHSHPPQSFVPREAVIPVEGVIKDCHRVTPIATPARLKIDASESLMSHLALEIAAGMSSQEVEDIWNSMMALASKEKFHAILRKVRMENPAKREFNSIRDMQQNIHFPFVHCFLFLG